MLEAESTQSYSAAVRITLIKNYSEIIGNRTRDLLACSAVPQSTAPILENHDMWRCVVDNTMFTPIFVKISILLTPER
jgi:hypothetical protein